MALRLGLAVVAPDHLARHAADRVEQRLAVVGEAGPHLADHPLAVAGDLPPVDVSAHVLPGLEVALDDPVDDPAGLGLDLGRGVADDLPLERPPDALAVHEAPDAADPDGLLEEPHAPPLHVAEQHVEPGQARLDVAQHLVVRQRELAVDALDGLDVLGQKLQPLERDVLVPGREPEPHVERVEELEPDPLLLVERPHQVGVDLVQPAGAPRLGRAVRPGRERLAGGDREEAGRLGQERLGMLAHEAEDLLAGPPGGEGCRSCSPRTRSSCPTRGSARGSRARSR